MSTQPGVRVLVVDDDRAVRAIVRDILGDEGYEVYEAANGREALSILLPAASPWVVLLDQRMPDMTGTEVLAQALGEGGAAHNRAFILLTGDSDCVASPLNDPTAIPAVPVLGKPFEISALLDAVAAAMRRIEAADDDARAADVAAASRRDRGRQAT